MANMINLTINGKNVSVEKGTTIIEAAKKLRLIYLIYVMKKTFYLLQDVECVLLK